MARDSIPPSGDAAALRRAIEKLHPASSAWARACAGNDADDVLQSTYEKVISGRARFDGRSSVKTWLFGVIRMTALEHRRRGWLHALRTLVLAEEPRASRPPSAEGVTDAARTASALLAALDTLPERQRQVLHLVFYEDLTVDEAAQAIGVTVGTARVHYDRGKKRLAELLQKRGIGS